MGKIQLPSGFKPEQVSWTWRSGEPSDLHRKHMRYEGMTWCGAFWSPTSEANRGATVYEGHTARKKAVKECSVCFGRSAGPIFIPDKEPEHIQLLAAEVRRAHAVLSMHKRALNMALGVPDDDEPESHSNGLGDTDE